MKHFQSIQYLRAAAVIMVVFFHAAGPSIGSLGAAGVDIFFVISGFIMWVITETRETSVTNFAYHRLVRIVPLYWIFTLALAGAFMIAPQVFSNLKVTPSHLIKSLLFVPHVDPTDGQISPVLRPGWSLDYEMFFYSIFAISLFLSKKFRITLILAALLLLPLLGIVFHPEAPILLTYSNPIMLEFLGGTVFGFLYLRGMPLNAIWATTLFIVGMIAFAIVGTADPVPEHLRVLVWGVPGILLVVGLVSLEQTTGIPQIKSLGLLGDASYSIYLSHTIIISAIDRFADWLGVLERMRGTAVFIIATIAISALCGIVVYFALERPMLERLRHFAPNASLRKLKL
jgi:exopolysaccharide production protein ExoZ